MGETGKRIAAIISMFILSGIAFFGVFDAVTHDVPALGIAAAGSAIAGATYIFLRNFVGVRKKGIKS